MRAGERIYALMLRAYPAEFRAAFGAEMRLACRDARRARGRGGPAWWWELVLDVARSAPALHAERLRARVLGHTHSGEGTMRSMTMLAVAIGAFEIVNSLVELVLGGVQRHDGVSFAAGSIGAAAGVLLVAAGVALLRGGSRGVTLAQGAAVGCLLAFVLIGVALPRLSGAGMLLGIGFPVAMLLFLRLGGGPGTRAAA